MPGSTYWQSLSSSLEPPAQLATSTSALNLNLNLTLTLTTLTLNPDPDPNLTSACAGRRAAGAAQGHVRPAQCAA